MVVRAAVGQVRKEESHGAVTTNRYEKNGGARRRGRGRSRCVKGALLQATVLIDAPLCRKSAFIAVPHVAIFALTRINAKAFDTRPTSSRTPTRASHDTPIPRHFQAQPCLAYRQGPSIATPAARQARIRRHRASPFPLISMESLRSMKLKLLPRYLTCTYVPTGDLIPNSAPYPSLSQHAHLPLPTCRA